MQTATTKPTLPPLPARIASLPVDPVRGYPVPWFVAWVDGKPEFRVADGEKRVRAVRQKLCWVCGEKLGTHLAFLLGPMCAVNRVSAEPPCHRECAEFSVQACPFLSRPAMDRREGNYLCGETSEGPGVMLRRNPGVTLVWVTKGYSLIRDGGGFLFQVGEPLEVAAWREGRAATSEEVRDSIDSGLPTLAEMAEAQGDGAVAALSQAVWKARRLFGLI